MRTRTHVDDQRGVVLDGLPRPPLRLIRTHDLVLLISVAEADLLAQLVAALAELDILEALQHTTAVPHADRLERLDRGPEKALLDEIHRVPDDGTGERVELVPRDRFRRREADVGRDLEERGDVRDVKCDAV